MQALLQLPIIDGDLDAERRDARNEARRKRRQEKHAAAVAKAADPRVQRRRQCDREYQQAKRQAEGARPREAYLAKSVEAARPWEAEGISRSTWWRVRQVRRQQEVRQVHRQHCALKPLKYQHYPVKADGPEPKIYRGRTTTSDLRGATAISVKVASLTTARPDRRDRKRKWHGEAERKAANGGAPASSGDHGTGSNTNRRAGSTGPQQQEQRIDQTHHRQVQDEVDGIVRQGASAASESRDRAGSTGQAAHR